jgi:hypothetical protein
MIRRSKVFHGTPLLSNRCYTRLIEVSILVGTARERNGAATENRLSGTGCAPNLSHMHGPNAMRSLFPPATIDTGIEMSHQSIQHIKHALRKHRALALLALTHLILQFSHKPYNKASIRFFQLSGQVFLTFFYWKEDPPCLPGIGLSGLTTIYGVSSWRTILPAGLTFSVFKLQGCREAIAHISRRPLPAT